MNIQWTIGTVTVAVAMVIVFSFFAASLANADAGGDKVFKQVMKECKHKQTEDVIGFIVIPGSMGRAPTLKEIDEYVGSESAYKTSIKGFSECWTRERWKIFARSELMEQRAEFNKATQHK